MVFPLRSALLLSISLSRAYFSRINTLLKYAHACVFLQRDARAYDSVRVFLQRDARASSKKNTVLLSCEKFLYIKKFLYALKTFAQQNTNQTETPTIIWSDVPTISDLDIFHFRIPSIIFGQQTKQELKYDLSECCLL